MRTSGKRKRVRLRAKPFLVIAVVLNLYIGLTRSPMTSIRHVRVEGAQDFDRARLESEIQSIKGIPCLQVDVQSLESRILSLSECRNASLSRNIFGSGLLRVAYRTPVARFDKSRRLALSDEGVVYAADHLDPNLPVIDIPQNNLQPNITLAGFWEPERVAYIAREARNIDVNKQERILMSEPGRVILYIGQGRVVLGNCESLDRKFQVLQDRLSRNPLELSQFAELDLTLPERPSVRRIARGSAP